MSATLWSLAIWAGLALLAVYGVNAVAYWRGREERRAAGAYDTEG